MEIKYILFDLDGTLLNTLGDLHAAFNYALKLYGFKERSIDEIRNFVGDGVKKAIERAVGKDVPDNTINEITRVFKAYYKEHMNELTMPYNGVVDLLEKLKNKGYKIGVVSNKFDAAVKELCRRYFNDLISTAIGESEEIRRKPNPDGVQKAIKELNGNLKEAVYIGDSDVDIMTAENAQIPCISVLWGFRNKEFLDKARARVYAQTPNDILKIIEKKLYLS